jgi:PAP2 superfamily
MINLDLTWQQAAAGAATLAVGAAALLRAGRVMGGARGAGQPGDAETQHDDLRPAATPRRLRTAGAFVREAAVVVGLFALWQLAGSFSLMGPRGATDRARWLWHAERVLDLPSEAALQRPILPHPLIVQAFDLYYDILHFPVLIVCLIWLFARHRERYAQFRITLVAFTGLCLLIQLIPVAPPRLLPEIGMVDTAVRYGQSVYSATGAFQADQLSAMPSVHVGWAILVAMAVIVTLRSRWRWLAIGYPVMTTLAVVVTANHFWLDGIAAAIVLLLVLAAQWATRWLRGRRAGPAAPAGTPRQPARLDPADRISSATCRASRLPDSSTLAPSTCSIWRKRSYSVGPARPRRLAVSALLPPVSR